MDDTTAETKPDAGDAAESKPEAVATEPVAAPASGRSALESVPVMGENFERTVREIMDMMGHGRDEVSCDLF